MAASDKLFSPPLHLQRSVCRSVWTLATHCWAAACARTHWVSEATPTTPGPRAGTRYSIMCTGVVHSVRTLRNLRTMWNVTSQICVFGCYDYFRYYNRETPPALKICVLAHCANHTLLAKMRCLRLYVCVSM